MQINPKFNHRTWPLPPKQFPAYKDQLLRPQNNCDWTHWAIAIELTIDWCCCAFRSSTTWWHGAAAPQSLSAVESGRPSTSSHAIAFTSPYPWLRRRPASPQPALVIRTGERGRGWRRMGNEWAAGGLLKGHRRPHGGMATSDYGAGVAHFGPSVPRGKRWGTLIVTFKVRGRRWEEAKSLRTQGAFYLENNMRVQEVGRWMTGVKGIKIWVETSSFYQFRGSTPSFIEPLPWKVGPLWGVRWT